MTSSRSSIGRSHATSSEVVFQRSSPSQEATGSDSRSSDSVAERAPGPVAEPASGDGLLARYELVEIDRLLEHEQVEEWHVRELYEDIGRCGLVRTPLLVADGDWVILNGHHRYSALRRLGAHLIPAWLVDYNRSEILVEKWETARKDLHPSKADVVRRAKRHNLYPPKTSRHVVLANLPAIETPLSALMPDLRPRRTSPRILQ